MLLAAAFLSGAVALGLEVLWTRMLALVHESSVQSFATVLAIFLVATGSGAAISRSLLTRGFRPWSLVGAGWIGAGLWTAANPRLFWMLSSGLDYLGGSESVAEHGSRIAGLALATVLRRPCSPASRFPR